MNAQLTPKIGFYRNALYYFQQNYINWKYYADDRLWNSIEISTYSYVDFLRSESTFTYIGQSIVNISTALTFTEYYFKLNLADVNISISSDFPQSSEIIRYVAYSQNGEVAEDTLTSLTVSNVESKSIHLLLPIGEMSDQLSTYTIDLYIKNRNVATIIKDSKIFQKSYNFYVPIELDNYQYVDFLTSIVSAAISTSALLIRSDIQSEQFNIEYYSYADFLRSELTTNMTASNGVTRMPITSEQFNIEYYSYADFLRSERFTSLQAYTVKTY